MCVLGLFQIVLGVILEISMFLYGFKLLVSWTFFELLRLIILLLELVKMHIGWHI